MIPGTDPGAVARVFSSSLTPVAGWKNHHKGDRFCSISLQVQTCDPSPDTAVLPEISSSLYQEKQIYLKVFFTEED